MRVLLSHTATLPERMGGSERVVWELGRGLAARGHDVRIVARRTLAASPGSETIDGITIRRYADPAHTVATLYLPSVALAAAALRKAVRGWVPDVVHAHHAITGLGASLAGVGPRCYTFYGPWHLEFLHEVSNRREMPLAKRWTRPLWAPAKARLARAMERAALGRSARIVGLSEYSRRQLAEIHGVAGPRVELIPGGVDLERFAPAADRLAARRRLGLPREDPLIFTVRRLVPRMGLEMLLEALERLPGTHLIVGGSGWLKPRLEQKAAELSLDARVRFVGFVRDEDLPLYYRAADLVALPSVALEGFGLITLEALACGTPVVATPESGAVDVLAPFEPSWVAGAATPEAFAGTARAALARAGKDRAVEARCRGHAEQYGWERIVDRYEALYRSLKAAA